MCRDAHNYIDGYSEHPVDVGWGEDYVPDWTVDEMMDEYSWVKKWKNEKRPASIEFYNDIDSGDWRLREHIMFNVNGGILLKEYHGESRKDCALQLVMWDRHKMTWDDEQSKWTKDGE